MKTLKNLAASITLLAAPLLALAQVTGQKKDLNYLIGLAAKYLNQALLLLMGLAVLFFVWNIIRYFIRPNDKRAEGASYLMWSVIGFAVILCFWGLVNILVNTFDLNTTPGSWSDYFNIFPK